jgi:hypothetical protein
MIATSAAYDSTVVATTRRWVPRTTITWTDPTIDPTIDTTANDLNRHSYPSQIADLVIEPTHRWAHLDGTCACDAGYYVCPETTEINDFQMGWWGDTTSGVDSSFSGVKPTLTITFNARPVDSLLVTGDSIYNEYPINFDIDIYDGTETLLYHKNVDDNAAVSWSYIISDSTVLTAEKMVLTINAWNLPGRVVKILEFYTGITGIYQGDVITSIDVLEESEMKGSTPVGNISSNELDLSLQNINIGGIADPFMQGNTNSPYNNLLLKNRKIEPEIGLYTDATSIEYIPMGIFWSGDWDNKEQGTVVTTSCRDRLGLLQ